MNRRTILTSATTAVVLTALPSISIAQKLDTDNVKAALDAFYAALSARDMSKMDAVWAHDADVMLVNPRDKSVSVGWDTVKANWEKVFGAWTELKVTRTHGPIRVSGNVAWAMGNAEVVGKSKDGAAVSFVALNSDIFEKRGEKWLRVSHSGWRAPQ